MKYAATLLLTFCALGIAEQHLYVSVNKPLKPLAVEAPNDIGAPILAYPEFTFLVSFEDAAGLGDADFNDMILRVDVSKVTDNGLVHVKISQIGGLTGYTDSISGPLEFDMQPRLEIILMIYVDDIATFWSSGDASRNPDGKAHAWVIGSGPGPVPVSYRPH